MSLFDCTNTQDSSGFELLPNGEYAVALEKVEVKISKNNEDYLNCQFKVIDGAFAGRVLFEIFMHTRPDSDKAKGKLKGYLKASETPIAGTIDDLVGRKSMAIVKQRENEYNGVKEMKNYISYFKVYVKDDITF